MSKIKAIRHTLEDTTLTAIDQSLLTDPNGVQDR